MISYCSDVADLTGAPEMLGGRVKTLHPAIHGGKWGPEVIEPFLCSTQLSMKFQLLKKIKC